MTNRFNAAMTAVRWLGTQEGTREHRELLAVYNAIQPLPRGYSVKESDPWCAVFVSAAAVLAGLGEQYPLECSCGKIIEKAKTMGIWTEADDHVPEIGDWVLYNWQAAEKGDDTGGPDHVGIVIGRDGGRILAVEGNYDNAVKLRWFPLDWKNIRGYVCPRLGDDTIRTLAQVPEYARPTIEKLLADGSLRGIAGDDLGISPELLRTLVILDRRGKL